MIKADYNKVGVLEKRCACEMPVNIKWFISNLQVTLESKVHVKYAFILNGPLW